MELQTIIVILAVAGSAFYLIRKYTRAAKTGSGGGCGCGCGEGGCPAEKRQSCESKK